LTFSRQDLADLCGTTVETAIRTMSRLSRRGIVQTAPTGFLVRDVQRLGALAQGRRRPASSPARADAECASVAERRHRRRSTRARV
jgi:hypothetical protein